MDHSPSDYKSTGNPIGVGACFGVTVKHGTDKDNQLDVEWYDGERLAVKQVLSWTCPPVGSKLRVKDPVREGRLLLIEIEGYSQRGVTLFVTPIYKKGETQKPNLILKTKRKRKQKSRPPARKPTPQKKSPQPEKRDRKRKPTPQKKSPRKKKVVRREKLTSEDEGFDSEFSSTTPADSRWKRFRRDPLDALVTKKIIEQVVIREQELIDESFDKEQWICFVDRVAREYLFLHDRNFSGDTMHLYREATMTSAVSVVLTQLRPLTVKPMDGKLCEIVPAVQRIIEHALDLSGKPKKEKSNTPTWIAAKVESGDMTFRECDQHPELMDAKVQRTMMEWYKKGSKTGAYMLREGQRVPGPEELYQLSDRRVGRRRATVRCACSRVSVPAQYVTVLA